MSYGVKISVLLGGISLLLSLGLCISRAWSFIYSEMIMFVVYAVFTAWSMFRIKQIAPFYIFLSIFVGWGILNIPLRFLPETAISLPNFIMDILGILAGYAYYYTTANSHRILRVMILTGGLIILLIIYPVHSNWFHYINFKNFTGVVDQEPFESFSACNFNKTEPDIIVGLKKDQYYIIDFWHSRCGYCIDEFSQFQDIYDKFNTDPNMTFCAISTRDGVGCSTSRFNSPLPFYYCDRSIEKYFKVFPTYLVVYNSKIIFRGNIDSLSSFLTKL